MNMYEKYVSPPLPLVRFAPSRHDEKAVKTMTSEVLRHLPNNLQMSVKSERIHDPLHSRRLAKWFASRASEELAVRQAEAIRKVGFLDDGPCLELIDHLVYESHLFTEALSDRLIRTANRHAEHEALFQKISQVSSPGPPAAGIAGLSLDSPPSPYLPRAISPLPSQLSALLTSPSVEFDAEFESGNLFKAVRVLGRDALCHGSACPANPVQQEYDLTLRNDINTDGNIQWYYFLVKPKIPEGQTSLTVRFNIINMQKKDSLYNYGLKPAVCHGDGIWGHGGHDIAYYRNSLTSLHSAVQFAYTFPYTYSDLIRYLDGLNSIALHRRSLTVSLAGNDVPLLTISNRSVSARAMAIKPVVFLSGRVHPGEAHASYVLQGALEYLLSDSQEANRLRDKFIFLIVPCLNPDGVIHGNYRCSLAGVDLNRRYRDGNALTPTITAWKELMRATAAKRQVLLYLDLHGHSARKNAFIYGCDPTTVPPVPGPAQTPRNGEEDDNKRVFARLFPKVLSATSKGVFAYRDCAFTIAKSKAGTGRVVAWRDIGILGAYTVEVSFCGSGDNSEFKLLKKMDNALALAMPPDVAVAVEEAAEDTGSEMDAAEDEDGRDDDSNTRSAKSSLSSQAAVAAPPALSIPAMLSRDPQLTHLLSTYRSATMYSVPDLLAMGRSIVTGIYHYTNLTHADLEHESEEQEAIAAEARRERGQSGKTTPSNAAAGFASARKFPTSYSSGRLAVDKGVVYNTDSSDEDSGSIPSPMVPIANAMAATVAVPKPSVMSFEEGDSSRSLGTTGVFGPQALASLLQTYPQEFSVMDKSTYHVGVRIKCELLLRRQLGISHASLPLSRLHAVLPADHTEPEATSLDGSDSNPSQDNNTHLNRLRGGFGGWCGALRKAMLARQAEVEAASKKYKDKLLKKLIKEAAAAEAERRRKAAEAAEAAKAQIPRPRPSTATSRLPVKRVPLIPRTQQYRLSQDYAKIAVTNPQPLPTSMVNITMMSSRDADRTRIGQLQQAELAQLAQTQAQQAQFQQQMQMSSPRRDSFNSASSGMLVSPLTYERPASANAASRRSSVGTIGSTMPTPRSRAAEGGNPLRAMPTIVSPPPPASPAHTLSAGTNAAASPGTTMYVRPTGHGPTPTLTRVNSSPTAPTTPTTPRLTVVAPQLTHNVMLVRPSTSSGMRGSTAGTNLISPLRTLAKPEGKMLPDLLPLLSSPSNIKRK